VKDALGIFKEALEAGSDRAARPSPQLAHPSPRRRFILALLAGLVLLCIGAGGAAWYVGLRCDRASYLSQVAQSWTNQREEYLFACGQVWHSVDAGKSWKQIHSLGLPFLARQGRIATDRRAGRLYLAILLAGRFALNCLLCPLTRVRPVMYHSDDGGQHWRVVYEFQEGTAGITRFRVISSDPDYTDSAWTVVVYGDRVSYFASNDGGLRWHWTSDESR
jgi:photosystem II stability/assembly factor-like uncharacterized protein